MGTYSSKSASFSTLYMDRETTRHRCVNWHQWRLLMGIHRIFKATLMSKQLRILCPFYCKVGNSFKLRSNWSLRTYHMPCSDYLESSWCHLPPGSTDTVFIELLGVIYVSEFRKKSYLDYKPLSVLRLALIFYQKTMEPNFNTVSSYSDN